MVENRNACLSDEYVAAYIDKALTADELKWIEAHLPSCVECANRVEMVRSAVEDDIAHPERLETTVALIESILTAKKGRLN